MAVGIQVEVIQVACTASVDTAFVRMDLPAYLAYLPYDCHMGSPAENSVCLSDTAQIDRFQVKDPVSEPPGKEHRKDCAVVAEKHGRYQRNGPARSELNALRH